MPGMPDLRISSSAMPSSLATALSTAFSGKGIAGTSGGGTSAWVGVDGGAGSAGFSGAAGQKDEQPDDGQPGQCFHGCTVSRRLHGCDTRIASRPVNKRAVIECLTAATTGRPPTPSSGCTRSPGFGTAISDALGVRRLDQPLHRLGPRMRGEAERRPVDRYQQPRIGDVTVCTDRILGIHVNVGPARVIRAHRHQGEVERSVLCADVGEALRISGVAAEEGAVAGSDQRPRRPQGGVPGQKPSGEMPRRGAHQGEVAEAGAFVPVEFDDPVGGDVPGPKVSADAEGDEELGPLGARQLFDGVDVEVVVMVVADDDRVDRGQRLQRGGHRMQPPRARSCATVSNGRSRWGLPARGSRRSRSPPRSGRTR